MTNVPRHLQVEVAFGITSRPTVESGGTIVLSATNHHLKTHSLIHTGEKPQGKRFNCSQCNKSFSQAGNLKRHSLIHTGEKPHQCAQCNYSANQAVNPREHIKNHRGEKLKKCKQCDYTTTRSNSLKHHKRDPLWRKATQVHNLWVFQQLVNWMNDEEAHRRKPIQV